LKYTDPTGLLALTQYPAFLWHFSGEALNTTFTKYVGPVAVYNQVKEIINTARAVVDIGKALAGDELTVGDLISAMGQEVWDGLSGDTRWLIDNYFMFFACVELSNEEIKELAKRTAGAYEELMHMGGMLYGALATAKKIVAARATQVTAHVSVNTATPALNSARTTATQTGRMPMNLQFFGNHPHPPGVPAKTNLVNSATTPGAGGVTPVGRAFQKHNSRPGTAFTGQASGNASQNTQQGLNHLNNILNNPQPTITTTNHPVHGNVLNVRTPSGQGAQWSADGSHFIGFLEPYSR
jgi:hypothetical protein